MLDQLRQSRSPVFKPTNPNGDGPFLTQIRPENEKDAGMDSDDLDMGFVAELASTIKEKPKKVQFDDSVW